MKGKGIVLTGIGFIVGVGEAILFYNLGQAQGKGLQFRIPPGKEFLKTVGMVMATSVITTILFQGLEMMMADQHDKMMADNTDKK